MDAGVPEVARRVRKTGTQPDTVRIGITGHMDLDPATTLLVIDELRAHLRALMHGHDGRIVGVSCLAPGADQVFAHVLLEFGGTLEAIFPSGEYDGAHCESPVGLLLRRAASIRTIDHPCDRPQAYVAANEAMLDSIDALFAVWNGIRSDKPGGTAHVVESAWLRRIPVTVIWPEGASRLG